MENPTYAHFWESGARQFLSMHNQHAKIDSSHWSPYFNPAQLTHEVFTWEQAHCCIADGHRITWIGGAQKKGRPSIGWNVLNPGQELRRNKAPKWLDCTCRTKSYGVLAARRSLRLKHLNAWRALKLMLTLSRRNSYFRHPNGRHNSAPPSRTSRRPGRKTSSRK